VSARERTYWNGIYEAWSATGAPYPDPDPLLYTYTPPVSPGDGERRAIDLGCGLGQNGLWLARQGYSTDLADISRAALIIAQARASESGITNANFLHVDFDEIALQNSIYDVVCVFRLFKRDFIPRIRGAVRPGGRILYTMYNTRAPKSEIVEGDALPEPDELAGAFSDWRIIYQGEPGTISQLVAIKP